MQTFFIVSVIWVIVFACYDRFQTERINKLERKIIKYERMLYLKIPHNSNNIKRSTEFRIV